MLKKPLFGTLLALLVAIGLLHVLASYLYWYWYLGWLDFITHLLSGILVSLSAVWLYYLSGIIAEPRFSQARIFFLSVGAALVVGILWEVFELQFGITSLTDSHYFSNNGGDILVDISGGLLGFAYFSYQNHGSAV